MATLTKEEAESQLQRVMAQIPKNERELEAFFAKELAEAIDKESEALARFGKSAAGSTMFAWRLLMRQVAERLLSAPPTRISDMKALGDIILKSVDSIVNLRERAARSPIEELEGHFFSADAVAARIEQRFFKEHVGTDMAADAKARALIGVPKDPNASG